VEKAAGAVAAGSLDTQVPSLPAHTPRELRGLSASFNDMVNELRRREEGLRFAMNEADTSNRAKTEFLANMSHELRTPLNAVIGFTEMMRNETFGPLGSKHYVGYADDILHSSSHLLDVINGVLDMAKIEAGELKPAKSDFALTDVVEACLRMIEDRALEGRTAICVDLAHGLPLLHADKTMIGQIVLNLLSNAVKFADGGQVHLAAEVDKGGCLAIAVSDTGIGIAPENIRLVLQPFCQVDTTLERRYDGTGLGLPLVNSMARLHGANVRIDSELGRGTTVTVRFPPDALVQNQAVS
jgi:signal transduction histidine kinase